MLPRTLGLVLCAILAYAPGEQVKVVRLADKKGNNRCTGVAIAPRWAVTAGHCLSHFSKLPQLIITPGASVRTKVGRCFLHPEYRLLHHRINKRVIHMFNDIGLVEALTDLMDISPTQLQTLRNQIPDPPIATRVIVQTLTRAAFPVPLETTMYLTICWGEQGTTGTVCASCPDPKGVILCSGDSGSPVFLHGILYGLLSLAPQTCENTTANQLSVSYAITPLSHYGDLIVDTVVATELHGEVFFKEIADNDSNKGRQRRSMVVVAPSNRAITIPTHLYLCLIFLLAVIS